MAETKKGVSRREFILGSGAVLAGGVVPWVIGTGVTPEVIVKELPQPVEMPVAIPKEAESLPPASTTYLVVDSQKCSGCLTCMFTCSAVHDKAASLSNSRIQIAQNSLMAFPYDLAMYQCRQCTDPTCVDNCPTGACQVDTAHGNVRMIDQAKCIGCGTCIRMCPHAAHRSIWQASLKKATKCDLCTNAPYFKPAAGKPQQACVAACPMNAITVVTKVPDQTDDRGYDVNLRKT